MSNSSLKNNNNTSDIEWEKIESRISDAGVNILRHLSYQPFAICQIF